VDTSESHAGTSGLVPRDIATAAGGLVQIDGDPIHNAEHLRTARTNPPGSVTQIRTTRRCSLYGCVMGRSGSETRGAHRRPGVAAVAFLVSSIAASGAFGVGAAASLPRAHLKVDVSVPSVLAGNPVHLWLANTGTSSVLELSSTNGAEVRNVSGTRYRFDISDAIAASGRDVWVANASSNTVTEFRASDGRLIHVLGEPAYRFEVPVAIAIADHHVFVLNQAGSKVLELNETTGKVVRVLTGPRYHFIHTVGMVAVHDDVWTANGGGKGTLTEFSAASGRVLRVATSLKARLNTPVAIASDGVHLWVANESGSHLSELLASTGTFDRILRVRRASLDAVTSMAVADRTVWVARAGTKTLVIGVNSMTGRTVRCTARKFGYPAVFSDGRHVWVVDRTQSRLSEVIPLTGKVLRVISN
jgi:DNA-binding beta-propeller fold protein YncE